MTEVVEDPLPQSLRLRSLAALLLAMFATALGHGFLLPILRSKIARVAGTPDPDALARHTGILNANLYVRVIFVRAAAGTPLQPVWEAGFNRHRTGWLRFHPGDVCHGRQPVFPNFGRFLNGAFASSISPVAYVLIGDHAPTKEWRAHRFALLNIAEASGVLAGPMLGGFVLSGISAVLPVLGTLAVSRSPFLLSRLSRLSWPLSFWHSCPAGLRVA